MKIFDLRANYSLRIIFFVITKNFFFLGGGGGWGGGEGKIAYNNKNGADSCEIPDSNPICVCYCSIM